MDSSTFRLHFLLLRFTRWAPWLWVQQMEATSFRWDCRRLHSYANRLARLCIWKEKGNWNRVGLVVVAAPHFVTHQLPQSGSSGRGRRSKWLVAIVSFVLFDRELYGQHWGAGQQRRLKRSQVPQALK